MNNTCVVCVAALRSTILTLEIMQELHGGEYLGTVLGLMYTQIVEIRRLQLPEELQILVSVQHKNWNMFLRERNIHL